jgi:hypothetical protein
MATWTERAWQRIDEVHRSLPAGATLEERRRALREAYPFGMRAMHPYKAWCAAQKKYLARYDKRPAEGLFSTDTSQTRNP